MQGGHRSHRTKFLPLFCSGVGWKAGITFGRLMKFSRYGFPEKKNTAHAAQRWFCRVNRRQNESGVLRGGWSFRDNPRWGSVQNEHDHILWMACNQSTRAVGFTRKIPRHVECVKRVLKNLLKWSKKSMTHLVALGKNTLCESEQTPFSVCGRSFYCRQQQDVAFLTIV